MPYFPKPEELLPWRRICVYGEGGTGKSRLVTSLPWGSDLYGDKALYIAVDDTAILLDSILEPNKDHLIPVELRPADGQRLPDGSIDYHDEIFAIVSQEWEKNGVGTIILDGVTSLAEKLLAQYAKLGRFSSNPVSFGRAGTAGHFNNPTEGDYGAAQSAAYRVIDFLFQRKCSVIVVAHEDIAEPKKTNTAQGIIGGPQLVGHAKTRELGRRFSTLLRLEVQRYMATPTAEPETQFVVHTENHGIWQSKIHSSVPELGLGDVLLEPDPASFWLAYEAALAGDEVDVPHPKRCLL